MGASDRHGPRETKEIDRFRDLLAEPAGNRYVVLLGLEREETPGLVAKVRKGLPYRAFERLQAGLGLPAAELAEIVGIAPRTLLRRRERGRLDPDESDRLLRVSRVLGKALELFDGDADAARSWLRSPAPALGGAVPLELARSEIGAREVERLADRLEHGIYP